MTQFLLDVNVLLALSLPTHHHHRAATDWFATEQDWVTTPMTESAYVRLLINPRVVGYSIPADQAVAAVRSMQKFPRHQFVPDTARLSDAVIHIEQLAGTKQVTNFHLINLAASQGLRFLTFDGSARRALHPDDRHHVEVLTD